MTPLFEEICRDQNAYLVEADGETDHVHLLVRYPPSLSIPGLVQQLKRQSTRTLLAKYLEIKAAYIRLQKWQEKKMTGETRKTDRFWSPSYFAESAGRDFDHLRKYIANQNTQAHKAKRMSRGSTSARHTNTHQL